LNCPFHPSIQAIVETDPRFRLITNQGLQTLTPEEESQIEGLLLHPAGTNRVVVDGALLRRFPRLKVVSNQGVGVDHISLEDARRAGVQVGNTPNTVTASTADMAWALILSVARRVVAGDAISRAPSTTSFDPLWLGKQVTGATLGVIGCGRIGQAVVRRGRAFDMPILYHNRSRLGMEVERAMGGGELEGVAYCQDVKDLVSRSDFIVLAAPSSPETKGMISRELLGCFKPGSCFINVARGDLVDQEALCAALRNGPVGAAGLDVTSPEPLPRGHELLQMDNCVITPHTGTATLETRRLMNDLAVENLVAGLQGLPLKAPVV